MKKILVMFAALVLAIVVTACAGGSDNNGNTGGSAPENEETTNNGASNNGEGAGEEAVSDETITVTHQLGETPVQKNPETVVVFDFGTLDTLDKLGVEVTGVPQNNVPEYLSKYAGDPYVNVGSLKEPDFETIYGLQPDLIIISGRQSSHYDDLSEIAPTIFMGVDNANYMESFRSNVTTLGEIFGKEDVAEAELAAIETDVAALHEKMSTGDENGLIILVTGGNVSAYGPGSRFGIIHDAFGIPAADEGIEVSTHGMSVSFEYITEQDPDYLFVIDRDAVVGDAAASAAAGVLDNELIHGTKAYQNDQIVYLNPQYWYLSGGGLISVAEMLKEIEAGVQ